MAKGSVRKKVRIVDFGNALADIFKKARKQQLKNRMQYGELYHRNFYKEVMEKAYKQELSRCFSSGDTSKKRSVCERFAPANRN